MLFSKTKNAYSLASHTSSLDSDFELAKNETDEEAYLTDYHIQFNKELSNGTIVFMIIDEDTDYCDHIILTSSGKITIIPSDFCEFDDNDYQYL